MPVSYFRLLSTRSLALWNLIAHSGEGQCKYELYVPLNAIGKMNLHYVWKLFTGSQYLWYARRDYRMNHPRAARSHSDPETFKHGRFRVAMAPESYSQTHALSLLWQIQYVEMLSEHSSASLRSRLQSVSSTPGFEMTCEMSAKWKQQQQRLKHAGGKKTIIHAAREKCTINRVNLEAKKVLSQSWPNLIIITIALYPSYILLSGTILLETLLMEFFCYICLHRGRKGHVLFLK